MNYTYSWRWFYSVHKLPIEYVLAFPIIITRSPLFWHSNFPPLSEICVAFNLSFPSLKDQKGINEQCAEPVTGSSIIDARGVKNLDTKSQFSPFAVTITPPGQGLFGQIFDCQL